MNGPYQYLKRLLKKSAIYFKRQLRSQFYKDQDLDSNFGDQSNALATFFGRSVFSIADYVGGEAADAHRSRTNPSRSKIILQAILRITSTKFTLKDLIDNYGLRFESKSRIFKV